MPQDGQLAPAGAETARGAGRWRLSREAGVGSPDAAGSGRADWVPWLIALAVFAAYLPISVFRYLRLEPTSWDLGIFTQYVKQYAHLRAPIVDIRGAGVNLLGDHFHPIVALIAPFFRLFPSPVTLLVAQALLAAVSVIPVSRAAADRLGTGPAGPSAPRTGSRGACSRWSTLTSTRSPLPYRCWHSRCPPWSGAGFAVRCCGRCRWSW